MTPERTVHDWPAFVRERLPALPIPPAREGEIVEEIAIQLEGIYRTARAGGASESEAYARVVDEIPDWPALAAAVVASKYPHTAAARQLNHSHVAPFVVRQPLAASVMEALRELRYAARALAASPVFAFAATATLALGVGATTAVFSLVHGVLLTPLPFRDASRLAVVQEIVPEIAERYPLLGANPRSFRAWTNGCRSTCESLAVLAGATGTLTSDGEPEGLVGARVSPNFFDVLGLPLLAGRSFTEAEDRPGADAVVVLSHALWTRRFGSDRSVVDRIVELDGRPTRVIGVLASVELPRLGDLAAMRSQTGVPEFFRPLAWSEDLLRSAGDGRQHRVCTHGGRGNAGASGGRARRPHRDRVPHRDHSPANASAADGRSDAGPVAASSPACCWPLFSRRSRLRASTSRTCWADGGWLAAAQLAIRSAMARTPAPCSLVASESALLAATGGTAGLLVAWGGLRTLIHFAPAGIPRLESVRLDAAGFGFALVTVLCCGIVCSLLPARHVLRGGTGDTLKSAAHTTTGGPAAVAIRGWLVGVEIALTSALLVLGGLLVLSLHKVLSVDPGFDSTRVLAVDLRLPQARYPDAASRTRFFDALLLRVQSAPGVVAAGITRVLPLEGEATIDGIAPVGDTRPFVELPVANHLQVSPDTSGRWGCLWSPDVGSLTTTTAGTWRSSANARRVSCGRRRIRSAGDSRAATGRVTGRSSESSPTRGCSDSTSRRASPPTCRTGQGRGAILPWR